MKKLAHDCSGVPKKVLETETDSIFYYLTCWWTSNKVASLYCMNDTYRVTKHTIQSQNEFLFEEVLVKQVFHFYLDL
jgi:hypothetical protein